jgi:hypothetical protein
MADSSQPIKDQNDDSTQKMTEVVIEVLRSLNVINADGQPVQAVQQVNESPKQKSEKKLFGEDYKPHSASRFGMSDQGAALDDLLSQSSMLPIHQVEGAKRSFAGMNTPGLAKGPMDMDRARTAAAGPGGTDVGWGRGTTSFNGLQMDPLIGNSFSMLNFSLSRSNPYMVNRMYGSGMYGDIPVYFLMMQEQNGGLLYWPVSIREKYQWYRYFVRTDPYVGAIIDLHTDLPVSRIGFTMPKLKNDPDGSKAKECLHRCQKWGEEVGLFERVMEGIYEYNVIGNVFYFCEYDEAKKWWSKLTILPPEEVGVVHFPFCDFAFAEYKPEPLIKLVSAVANGGTDSSQQATPLEKAIYDNIPDDIVNSIRQFGSIIMDTDPMTGSFVMHLARKRSPYADLGVSTLERCIIPLLQKEHFKYTQLSLSSRLMTPRNKIAAPGISPDATDNLRAEIDLSMEDPDYHVVTNFDFTWDLIGAENRLIQLQPEYERIENEIFAALGATKELVTGEASYGGAKVTAEILNTRYLLVREVFKNFVEKKLLHPMAVKNDWYEEDPETGEREYYYPMLTFNRLTIRDNQEMFDALFQLYQKGSLPIQVIYELFNLNPDEMNDVLVDDMFTVRDATFNEMLRQVHTDLGSKLVEETDIFTRVSNYCGLTRTDEEGQLQTTPVADLGGDIFNAPQEETAEDEEAPPEDEEGLEDTEGGGEEGEGGGLEEALADLGGGEEEGGGGDEEIIE